MSGTRDAEAPDEGVLVAAGAGLGAGLAPPLEDPRRPPADARHHGRRGEGLRQEGRHRGGLCPGAQVSSAGS